ncbi:hypothetical protein [Fusobacterium varium]
MKKSLEEKINKYCDNTEYPFEMYYSDIIPDARYKNDKYFLKYHHTNNVAHSFKTQNELESFLDEAFENNNFR